MSTQIVPFKTVVLTRLFRVGRRSFAAACGAATRLGYFASFCCLAWLRLRRTILFLIGNGDGTFQNEVDTTVSGAVQSLAVGDFNGDGKADVVATSIAGGNPSINIFLSNGNGTFSSGAQYTANGYPVVAAADVNRDGKLDLVVTSFGEPLQVFLGNGDGTFQKPIAGPEAIQTDEKGRTPRSGYYQRQHYRQPSASKTGRHRPVI